MKVETRGQSSGSNSVLEMTVGTDGAELESLPCSGEEADSQSLGARAREGEGGGG